MAHANGQLFKGAIESRGDPSHVGLCIHFEAVQARLRSDCADTYADLNASLNTVFCHTSHKLLERYSDKTVPKRRPRRH